MSEAPVNIFDIKVWWFLCNSLFCNRQGFYSKGNANSLT